MVNTDKYHVPVLLKEVIGALDIKAGRTYIDATLGGGGHTKEILARGGNVIGIDQDTDAIEHVRRTLASHIASGRLVLVHDNFRNIGRIAKEHDLNSVAGVLLDLGMSTHHIEGSGRGFSYLRDEPLDMRMDVSTSTTAQQILNTYKTEELYETFANYAEEINSRAIAQAITRARTIDGKIEQTAQLVEIIGKTIEQLYPKLPIDKLKAKKIETASRIFQALRIVINDEITSLREALEQAADLLEPNGRLAVISFHSLEDRAVKLYLRAKEQKGIVHILTKKPIVAEWQEIKQNSKARSAKLRFAEKSALWNPPSKSTSFTSS